MRKLNDWKPETRSLIKSLTDAGFKILSGDNGEDRFNCVPGKMGEFLENLLACDETHLFVMGPDGKRKALFLVLGNSPGELVCDYTVSAGLDAVVDAHAAKWDGKPQPKVDCFERGDHAVWTAPDGTTRSVTVDIGGLDKVMVSWKTGPQSFDSAWTVPSKLKPFGTEKFLVL